MNIHPDYFKGFYEADVIEDWPNRSELPWLDQESNGPETDLQAEWQDDGVVILSEFMPDELIDDYCEAWIKDNGSHKIRPMGWPFDVPYMYVNSLMDMLSYKPLTDIMTSLIGEPMATHLNLTGWRSTQRNWHQDGYLNPDTNRDFYMAVWVALDDIHPDAGPFQFVRGSHRFPVITNEKILGVLGPNAKSDPNWPKYSEEILTPLFEQLIVDADLTVEPFLAKRGDVLLWHGRLMHRGSIPNDPELERRACIAHFSGIWHRPDMPSPALSRIGFRHHHQLDGHYFPITQNYV
ncbi:MAG: hypothetical protein CL489_15590 [Acidobacteria bacterium]|nr:hypothetical protein [Acidobacteriota bacterium]